MATLAATLPLQSAMVATGATTMLAGQLVATQCHDAMRPRNRRSSLSSMIRLTKQNIRSLKLSTSSHALVAHKPSTRNSKLINNFVPVRCLFKSKRPMPRRLRPGVPRRPDPLPPAQKRRQHPQSARLRRLTPQSIRYLLATRSKTGILPRLP